jgi:hypothetical protein
MGNYDANKIQPIVQKKMIQITRKGFLAESWWKSPKRGHNIYIPLEKFILGGFFGTQVSYTLKPIWADTSQV